jgi:hypothetical protein
MAVSAPRMLFGSRLHAAALVRAAAVASLLARALLASGADAAIVFRPSSSASLSAIGVTFRPVSDLAPAQTGNSSVPLPARSWQRLRSMCGVPAAVTGRFRWS